MANRLLPPDVGLLFEDNHLLALSKPAGLLTQPSGTARPSLEAVARAYVRETKGKTGKVFLHAVHRLDREASGVVLFARTSKALARMAEEIRARRVRKTYRAIVEGKPPRASDTLYGYIRHRSHRAETAEREEAGAKKAVLAYREVGSAGGLHLLEIDLGTGRYHQIRAQLAREGMPILGDRRYGSRAAFPGDGIALHHAAMEFRHPVSRETIRIEAPPPPAWPLA
ncbi:MAG: RNA pseudouridine synthase [Candidatus Eisenbacteria bacterium]|nr:RNA pseudouridine synthase [Candidatus Eisenbacteria bacterium]